MEQELLAFANKYYQDSMHPVWVAERFPSGSDHWIVGLFHDLLEDTDVKDFDLYQCLDRFEKSYLFEDILILTRRREETYHSYIMRVCESGGIAKDVKFQDLQHHLLRVDTLSESLRKRYLKALQIIS